MKIQHFLILALCFQALVSCHVFQKKDAVSGFVSWDKKMLDLGAVKKGETRSMFYEFTNTSGEPIQIDIVDACSCTKVDFPRGVIEKGGKGRLDVVFDSAEKEKPETISINIIFKNTHSNGVPRIEIVEYSFDIKP
jgi:peptidoglycan-associated lipoprotein